MKHWIRLTALAGLIVAAPAQAQTISVATAGDQNMVDYVKDYLGPMFEKANPELIAPYYQGCLRGLRQRAARDRQGNE